MSTLAMMEEIVGIHERAIHAGIIKKLVQVGRILPGEQVADVRIDLVVPNAPAQFLEQAVYTFPDYGARA